MTKPTSTVVTKPTSASTRRAGLLAAAIAVPIALVAGLLVFFTFYGRVNATASAPSPAAASPSAATGPVTMPTPSMSAAHKQMCLAFIAALPTALRTLPERHVAAGAEQNAAFGDPPITAECGATEPKVAPTDEIFPLSGVCWYSKQDPGATVWTTLDRAVPVAITIPDSYSGPGQWATEFRDAIIEALPSKATPYNC